ncbi:hypothetical protein GH714_040172 [Hevea brasiliensis]|uniref:Uncharacterized protein n=1 Tax=Hevea brasiliensis TaxID=3981 RepID=A0A6A6KW16_HEVBR|nr:hypothetical protein GH714_040172 [Hevea brasiliensis]
MDSWGLNYLQGNMTNSQGGGWDQGSNLNYLHPDLDLSLSLSIYSNSQEVQTQMHGGSPSQTTNVNEVTIIPQRTLSQAGENSEGNHSFGGLEVLAEATVILTENKAATSMCTNCKRKMLVDCDSNKKAKNVSEIEESSKFVPAPVESTFNCPICLIALLLNQLQQGAATSSVRSASWTR